MSALYSIVGIAFLLFVCLPLYTDYRIDKTRQSLFAIRDELFDAAARGEISFDSEAYRTTRLIMNGLIRFTHRASVMRVWLLIRLGARKNDAISREIAASFEASSKADRELCSRYLFEANKMCAKHFASSPLGMVLMAPFVLRAVAATGAGFVEELVKSKKLVFRLIDREAYAEVRVFPG
jgi:hypothetical protein